MGRGLMMSDFEDKFIKFFENDSSNSEAPDWLKEFRQGSANSAKELGIPDIKDEDWRFTSLKDFSKIDFSPIKKNGNKYDNTQIPEFLSSLDAFFILMVNGEVISKDEYPFKVSSLRDCFSDANSKIREIILEEFSPRNKDFFYELNSAFLDRGIFIELEESSSIDKPIVLINKFDSSANDSFINTRNIFSFSKNSRADIIEYTFDESNSRYFSNKTSFFNLDEDAKVEHLLIEDGSKESYIFSNLKVKQARTSDFTTNSILTGGKLIRNNVHPKLDGEGCYSNILGLYLSSDHQVMDNYMYVEHSKANCGSRQLYKGLLKDSSKGVFHGRIIVHEEAQQTNAYQTNRNLLLSDSAQVDTKPQLEIYADDVKCSHGATIGQLDKEALMYLRARGISKRKATSMLVKAFTDEVCEPMKSKTLLNIFDQVVNDWFAESGLSETDD